MQQHEACRLNAAETQTCLCLQVRPFLYLCEVHVGEEPEEETQRLQDALSQSPPLCLGRFAAHLSSSLCILLAAHLPDAAGPEEGADPGSAGEVSQS